MIDKATIVITLGAFPETFERIKEHLTRAIKRGVRVNLLTYGKVDLNGARITLLPIKNNMVITWKGQQLNLVVDGQESLISSFNLKTKQIYHASWSTNIYLSGVLHRLFLFEHTLNEIMSIKDSNKKLERIERILKNQEFFHNSDIPAFKLLWEKHK